MWYLHVSVLPGVLDNKQAIVELSYADTNKTDYANRSGCSGDGY